MAALALSGTEGELVLVRVHVNPRDLEDTLETLANLPFPVNPQLRHTPETIIEFPAWSSSVNQVESLLHGAARLTIEPMLDTIRAH